MVECNLQGRKFRADRIPQQVRANSMLPQVERFPCCSTSRYGRWALVTLFFAVAMWAGGGVAQVDEAGVHIVPHKPLGDTKAALAAPALPPHERTIFKDVDVVLVPVTVTDPMTRLVTGLGRENFEVFEGSAQQQIRYFSEEDAPVSVGIIFDASGSMADKIDKSRDAVAEFLKAANPQDEFFMIAFSDEPTLLADFTENVDDVQNKLLYASARGRTALLDAIYLGISKMHGARYPRKALLIISDGGDNHSRYTETEIRNLVKEADVQIFALGIYDIAAGTMEEKLGPQLLSEVTEVTGGHAFTIDSPNELAEAAAKIGIELRNQYVLGYRPANANHDGKWRKIKVKVLPPKGLPALHVYAKMGYYAPQ
jgi:Ca-activated chloride channel family protein